MGSIFMQQSFVINNELALDQNSHEFKEKIQQIFTYRHNCYHYDLDLGSCPQYWKFVLRNYDWSSLKRLSLAFCQLKDADLDQVANLNLPHLINLNICRNYGSDGLGYFLNCKMSHHLIELSLQYNSIGSKGVKIIAKCSFPNLKLVSLEYCSITNEGAKHLTKSNWPNIIKIKLNDNQIFMEGMLQLFALNSWGNLKVLQIQRNGVDDTIAFLTCTQMSYKTCE